MMGEPNQKSTEPKITSSFKSASDFIKSRRSEELIVGFCGPAGSGVSEVCGKVSEILGQTYDYEVAIFELSYFIDIAIKKGGFVSVTEGDIQSPFSKIDGFQTAGNELRAQFGHDVLARLAIKGIRVFRKEQQAKGNPRIAYLIDSLKHPAEAETFFKVYKDMFHLFGVLCPRPERVKRLKKNRSMTESEAIHVIDRDEKEDFDEGQNMVTVLQEADYFIRNDKAPDEGRDDRLERFVNTMMGDPKIVPNNDEYAMYIAQSISLTSGCLSRQVGAVILNKDGSLIATGKNDVPKPGGGLYPCSETKRDRRCFKVPEYECYNDLFKREIKDQISRVLHSTKSFEGDEISKLSEEIARTGKIDDLTEFCRAVHAEMDALIAVGRDGGQSVKGGTIFVTTFPCHNCAKHIVAAGIDKIVYIEPYEKSLAVVLHEDAVYTEDQGEGAERKVAFLHYDGVSPRKYMKVFWRVGERKHEGKMIEFNPKSAIPVVSEFWDAYPEFEIAAVKELEEQGVDLEI